MERVLEGCVSLKNWPVGEKKGMVYFRFMLVDLKSSLGLGYFGLGFDFGSDYERPGTYGVSHLIEHLISKKVNPMLSRMKRLGVEYDFYTSRDKVVASLTGLSRAVEEVAIEFRDRVVDGSLLWDVEEFENEKRTVLQEYENCFNEQLLGVVLNTLRRHYSYFNPIGLSEDVGKFSYEESIFLGRGFSLPSKVVTIGVDVPTVVSGESFKMKQPSHKFGKYEVRLEEVPTGKRVFVGLVRKERVSESKRARVEFLLSCLNDGIESPLNQEIRGKRGLSYFSGGFTSPISGGSVVTLFAMTGKREKSKLREVYREFFSGDLSRHLSRERFLDCYSSLMVEREKSEVLPFTRGTEIMLGEDPYFGVVNFSYEDAIEMLTEEFSYDKFERIEY